MTDEKFNEWYAAEEAKSYNARQPRDDHGRWSDGAGGISQGHAAHVMKHEGISDAAAAGVIGKIKDGTHKTREDVLKHIDSIHAADNDGAAAGAIDSRIDSALGRSRMSEEGRDTLKQSLSSGIVKDEHLEDVVALAKAHKIGKEVGSFEIAHASTANFTIHSDEHRGTAKERAQARMAHYGHGEEVTSRIGRAVDAVREKYYGQPAKEKRQEKQAVSAHEVWAHPRDGKPSLLNSFSTADEAHRFRLQQAKISAGYGMTHWEDNQHSKMMDKEGLVQMRYSVNSPEKKTRKSLEDDETEAIMDNTLISFGGEIKSVEETDTGYKFGGWLVVFDKKDVSGLRDRFTKSTDFDIEDGDRRSLYYNHGLDGTIKKEKLGDCHVSIKDAGVWISGELKKRSDYLAKHVQHIAENIKQFGLSSGAPAHLVERVKVDGGHEIKKWVLSEASITPTPAEPMTFCTSLKSLVEMEGDGDLFDDETKHLTALEFGQIEGSRFVEHLSRALAANGEFHERIEDLVSDRASNRKSGRVLSADKHAQISEYRDGLQTIVESLSALLDEHNPNADANAEAAESKSLDDEIEELEIGWMQQQLKLNDLLRKV